MRPDCIRSTSRRRTARRPTTQNVSVWVHSQDDYRQLGYMYLSPLPGSEYTSRQTRFVLVRFQNISPTAITNLSSFIQVTGAVSGNHAGQTKIAQDGRTVIFTMTTDFTANELVTVSLTPGVPAADGGPISPYQYEFVISTHLPGAAVVPAVVSVPAANPGGSPVRPLGVTIAAAKGVAGIMPNGVSVPSDFPWIVITTNDNPDPGSQFSLTTAAAAEIRSMSSSTTMAIRFGIANIRTSAGT